MNPKEYEKLVKRLTPKENKIKSALIAFFIGGLVGLFGELIIYILMDFFNLSRIMAYSYLALLLILFGSLSTALGFFDDWVSFAKAGLFLPTTGFAHSVTSSALDYKKDGLITGLGTNIFKLAGSVILYGIISAFFLLIGRMILGV